jgi:hypothetical protein
MLSSGKFIIFFFAIMLFSAGCHNKQTCNQLVEYVNHPKNDYVQEKTLNGIEIKVTYRPTELMICQELSRNETTSDTVITKLRKKYESQHYLTLSFSKNKQEILSNAANKQQFSMLVNQFAFGMGEKIFLTTAERDTLDLLSFHTPRHYGVSLSTDILLAFEREKQNAEYLTLKIQEFGLKTGDTQFRINSNARKKFKVIQ